MSLATQFKGAFDGVGWWGRAGQVKDVSWAYVR